MRVEIRIVQPDSYSPKRQAFYRHAPIDYGGHVCNRWFRLPVKQAEQAIKTGRVHIGTFPDTEAVEWKPATKRED